MARQEPTMQIKDPAVELARLLIKRIDVDTAYGPQIRIDAPFEPGPPNPYLQELRPRVNLYLHNVAKPVTVAPYGEPPPTKWPMIRTALTVGGVVGGVFGIYWLSGKLAGV